MTNSLPLALGFALTGLGITLWAYKKLPRVHAWLISCGAFVLTLAIPLWRDSLAGLVSSPVGSMWLLGIVAVTTIGFWLEGILKHKHHRIRTPVIGAMFGVCLLLAIIDLPNMVASLGKSTNRTGTALSAAVHSVHSGRAAHMVAPNERLMIVAAGVAIVVLVIIAGVRIDKRKPAAAAVASRSDDMPGWLARLGGAQPQPAVTSGRGRRGRR